MKNFKKKFIYGFITIGSSWIIFEIISHLRDKKKLHEADEQIINRTRKFYCKDNKSEIYISKLTKDLINTNIEEKKHIINCVNDSLKLSNPDLTSVIKNIQKYTDTKFEINNQNYQLAYKKNPIWYPYIFRIFFSINNNLILLRWKNRYNFKCIKTNDLLMYQIHSKVNNFDKTLIVFCGLGGLLSPFNKIIDFFISKNYQILIPVYTPAQASLQYNFYYHESLLYYNLYFFLLKNHFNNVEIFAWSLGGMLYKGFEKYINKIENYDNIIYIKRAFLLEPLLGTRGSIISYFCKTRDYNDTIKIIDSVTEPRYFIHNRILGYLFHTMIGNATGSSFAYFSNVENKDDISPNFDRYLFISSDDIILNNKLDKKLIENNFDENKVYYRSGYHGGWIYTNRLLPILNNICNENYPQK